MKRQITVSKGGGEISKDKRPKELFRPPEISDKECLMRFCWGFNRSERDRYYFYVSLLLIETEMDLKDLLKVTLKQIENKTFTNEYPLTNPTVIKWLCRYSESKKCSFLLAKRSRQSYTYFFRKMMRKSGKVLAQRRIIPLLKRKK